MEQQVPRQVLCLKRTGKSGGNRCGNILDNALKYSTDTVEIENHDDNEQNIVICISDYGPGIPDYKHDLVFQRFYRIISDTTTEFGLGLALVQQIMSVLEGSIQLSNRLPHWLKATLTLTLPATGHRSLS